MESDREQMRRWVETWKRAGPELEEIRRREIERADTQQAIAAIFGTDDFCFATPPRLTSGLVEQQAWFGRLRAKKLA